MTNDEHAGGDKPAVSDLPSADAGSGDSVPIASERSRGRRTFVVTGTAIVAVIALGVLSSTTGLYPVWRSLADSVSPISPMSGPASKALVWRDAQGVLRRAAVNPVSYESFAAEQRKTLDGALIDTRSAARTRMEADVAAVFSEIEDRIPLYGEWYYRYTTKYV